MGSHRLRQPTTTMKTMQSAPPFTPANVNHDQASPVLCGVILAGGEGERLKPFVERLRGDSLPKQYVRFTGARSMIEHTFRRAERLIPRERLFTVVHQFHMNYAAVHAQLGRRHPGTVVAQPQNKDTGPGVLLPLVHLLKRYPNAVVAVFPSDQFVADEDRLTRHIRLASVIVERHPSRLLLLGMTPEYPEPEYGYIVPEKQRVSDGWGICGVAEFVEKPSLARARDMIGRGALWNTMLMVFHAGALFQRISDLRPDMHREFETIRAAIGTPRQSAVLREAYGRIDAVNMSRDLLEPLSRQGDGAIGVLPVSQVGWSDWGSEGRIAGTLAKMGRQAPMGGARITAAMQGRLER
jgi:mannose-1-phosphate guanylyltransferase